MEAEGQGEREEWAKLLKEDKGFPRTLALILD